MNWSQTTFIWRQRQQKHTNTLFDMRWQFSVFFLYLLSPLKKVSHINWNIRANVCVIYNTTATKAISTGTGLREEKKFFSMSVKNVCGENYKFRVHTTNKWQQTHRTKAHRNNCGNKFLYEYHENGSPWHTLMLFLSQNRQEKKKWRQENCNHPLHLTHTCIPFSVHT